MRSRNVLGIASCIAAALLCASPARAQNESALRRYFEGKQVIVRIDMPGTSDGVDVRADRRDMDAAEYGSRMKRYGASLRAGDPAVVTLVKVKNDHIEFQLGGGGFGTFGDDTSTSVTLPYVEKSRREIELEKRVRDENDRRVKRDLQRELDRVRDERERANKHIDAERAHLEELKRARIAAERRDGGSRFNVYFPGTAAREATPEAVMAALAGYVDFALMRGAAVEPSARLDTSVLWKGMPRADVEYAFGAPLQSAEHRVGDFSGATVVFADSTQRVTAEFVEDVLVRYSAATR
jgi:hypothetical protein